MRRRDDETKRLRRHPERSRGIHSALALCMPVATTLPRGLLSHSAKLLSKAFPFPAISDRSFDYAQDDGQGKRMSQLACLPLLLVMRLRRISIRPYRATILQGSEGSAG